MSIQNGGREPGNGLGHIDLINEDGSVHKRLPLAMQFFNPGELTQPGNIDRFYRGLITQPSQSYDGFMSEQPQNTRTKDRPQRTDEDKAQCEPTAARRDIVI
ncbi:hypothetical protein HPB51_017626 [Rhipicephalus microplus]|uniref:Uncharacterized protein n=1 Tax=Rhipicephalus microplus TaxID=6941 RepID=A0A9J6EIV3_RHIMP|nr:hypothetical protein HPB51_017626 [Rhipicephalus microplus]